MESSDEETPNNDLIEDAKNEANFIINKTSKNTKKVSNEKQWMKEINKIYMKTLEVIRNKDWLENNYEYYEFLLQNPEYFYYNYDKYENLIEDPIEFLNKKMNELKKYDSHLEYHEYYLNKYYLDKLDQLHSDILSDMSLFDTLPPEIIQKIALLVDDNGNLPNFIKYYPKVKKVIRTKGRLDLPKDILNDIMSYLTIPDIKNLGLTTSKLTSLASEDINRKLIQTLKDNLPKITSIWKIPNLIKELFKSYYNKDITVKNKFEYNDEDYFLDIEVYETGKKRKMESLSFTLNPYEPDNYENVHETYKGPEWLFRLLFDNGAIKIFSDLAEEQIEKEQKEGD